MCIIIKMYIHGHVYLAVLGVHIKKNPSDISKISAIDFVQVGDGQRFVFGYCI
jgi:hypothetical protein